MKKNLNNLNLGGLSDTRQQLEMVKMHELIRGYPQLQCIEYGPQEIKKVLDMYHMDRKTYLLTNHDTESIFHQLWKHSLNVFLCNQWKK